MYTSHFQGYITSQIYLTTKKSEILIKNITEWWCSLEKSLEKATCIMMVIPKSS